jgi:hypothetical protein
MNYLAPFIGAALLEVVHWYRLREKLDDDQYTKLLRSRGYWIITVLNGLLGAVGALIYYQVRPQLTAAELLVAGAAFPTLFTRLAATLVDKEATTLGPPKEEAGAALRTYLSVS